MPRQQVVRGKAPYDVIEVDEMGFPRCRGVVVPAVPQSRQARLELNPHYTDHRFNEKVGWEPQTVFGERSDDARGHSRLTYNYSDRLVQWDFDLSERAWKDAEESGAPLGSADFLERYLSLYHGKPVELVHVMAGVNRSNGYPYWVAGWRERPAGGDR